MAQSAKAQEPSMEEILASIRRIIADDEVKPPAHANESPQPAAARVMPLDPSSAANVMPPHADDPAESVVAGTVEPADSPEHGNDAADVLELTESMAASAEAAAGFRTIDGESDVIFADDAQPKRPEAPLGRGGRQPSASEDNERLLSRNARQAVDSAFSSLAQTVLVQNARTLEDLVRDMLRPMLKSWLDDNLPSLVERLVRSEIERVSRGRG